MWKCLPNDDRKTVWFLCACIYELFELYVWNVIHSLGLLFNATSSLTARTTQNSYTTSAPNDLMHFFNWNIRMNRGFLITYVCTTARRMIWLLVSGRREIRRSFFYRKFLELIEKCNKFMRLYRLQIKKILRIIRLAHTVIDLADNVRVCWVLMKTD